MSIVSKITAELNAFPEAYFPVTLCDPPWRFVKRARKTMRHAVPQRAPTRHYETICLDDLKALPVGRLGAKKSALIMWTFGAHLEQALELGRAWGYTYKTDLHYWLKLSKHGKRRISMGYYSRKEVEIVLLFTKKPPKVKHRGIRQMIEAPIREHSRKPDSLYDNVEAMFDGPYLEMFARTKRIGWESCGDDIFKFGFSGGKPGKGKLT